VWVVIAVATAAPPVRSVEQLDMQRFAGTWYEVARLPNRLQARCASDASATYWPVDDHSLKVVRRCRETSDRWNVSVGHAVAQEGDATGARFRLSHLPAWLQWWPGARDDHWVVMLDDDYRYAVVSDPGRRTLWILSRAPLLDPTAYDTILTRLRERKYPVDRLVATPQHDSLPATPFATRTPPMV
jgi:apolipoprotein D and lipocalin family protein